MRWLCCSYRDRYLKDLVMNVLQEMCSATEVEVDTSASAVNKQRAGGAVRDLMRAEAGIEPEVFQNAERGMDQLQKSLSHNQQEVQSAFRCDLGLSITSSLPNKWGKCLITS